MKPMCVTLTLLRRHTSRVSYFLLNHLWSHFQHKEMQLTEEQTLINKLLKLNIETREILERLEEIQQEKEETQSIDRETTEKTPIESTASDVKEGDTVNLLTPGRHKIGNTVPCKVVKVSDKVFVTDPSGRSHWRLHKNVRKIFKREK